MYKSTFHPILRVYCVCVGFVLSILLPFSAFAQFGEGVVIQKVKSVYIQEMDSTGTSRETAPFPKLNNTRYFQDKKLMAKIIAAKDSVRLHQQLLSKYVSQFGPENFDKDNDLIWQLAHDFQTLKDTVRALMMYEMAVKHSKGQRIPTPTMDSLALPTRCDWIPLEEYYQLLELRKRVDTLVPPKKVLQNMGKLINSIYADYAPFMHPSDSLLIFTSRRDKENEIDDIFSKDNEELYYAVRNFRTGKWTPAVKMDENINSTLNEGSACITPDGKRLYFTRCHAKDGMGDCDIYQADWLVNHWGNVKPLGGKVNSGSWDSHPNLSPDGSLLFFSSDRREGFGGTDIYFCTKQNDSTWNTAQNIGPVVNTPENEVTPFYSQVNTTLYFSSTGQLRSYGSFDIYKSIWTGLQWTEPQNLGPLVNTIGNEYYFSMNGKGETIYYAKSDVEDKKVSDQNFDLYSFQMPMEARPDAVQKISGYLMDSITHKPLVGRVVVIDLDNGLEIAPKRISENGYFEFNLKSDNRYRIYVVGDNYLTIRNDVAIKNRDTLFTIFTESFEQNRPLVFESLEFTENSSELAFSAKPKLDYLIRFLKNYPMFTICIKGHTDSDGSEDYNIKLSQRRANQIKDYLCKIGEIDPLRVVAEGYGETRPLVPNDNEENKRKNRRVEFELRKDPRYTGSMILPTKEETTFDDEYMGDELEEIKSESFNPEDFLDEFNLEDWEDRDEEGEEDLEKELENLEKENLPPVEMPEGEMPKIEEDGEF